MEVAIEKFLDEYERRQRSGGRITYKVGGRTVRKGPR